MTPGDEPRILVVDDDVDICHNLSDILTDLGYHVDCAHACGVFLGRRVDREAADHRAVDVKPPFADRLQVRAACNECDIVAGACKLRTVVAADRPGTKNRKSHPLSNQRQPRCNCSFLYS